VMVEDLAGGCGWIDLRGHLLPPLKRMPEPSGY
jgi:hypothetical protein